MSDLTENVKVRPYGTAQQVVIYLPGLPGCEHCGGRRHFSVIFTESTAIPTAGTNNVEHARNCPVTHKALTGP